MTIADGSIYAGFEQVKALRLRLEDLTKRTQHVIRDLGGDAIAERWQDDLLELEGRVHGDTFKVLVVGQFNRGKSTFINALLGKQVLPSYATPTTAVINEVKYGEHPQVLLYPRPRPDEPDPEPIEVPVEQLADYVVVKLAEANKPNPYLRADVFWPLELCRSGVELIDSPGLNENATREELTLEYLRKADAVVMLLDATQVVTASELDFFTNYIQPLGHDDVFWVFNRVNLLPEDQRESVETWARQALKDVVEFEQRIFFVDAKGALDARVAGEVDLSTPTNLPAVERSLERFLARQRGRNKVMIPARQLQRAVRDLVDTVGGEWDLLDQDVEDLREAYRRNKAPLDRLADRVDLLARNLDHQLDDVARSIDIMSGAFLTSFVDRMNALVNDVPISDAEDAVNPLRLRSVLAGIQDDIVKGAGNAIESELAKWATTQLALQLNSELQKVQHEVRDDVRDFEQELHAVRLDLSLVSGEAKEGRPGQAVVSADSFDGLRPAGAKFVGGQLIGGAVGGGIGAGGTALVLGVLGVGGVVFLPAVAAVAAAFTLAGALGAGDRGTLAKLVKKGVAKELATQWPEQAEQVHLRIVSETRSQLDQLKTKFREDLGTQVAVVQEQVDSALSDMNQGEERVGARKHELEGLGDELESLERDIEDVIDRAIALDSDRRSGDLD